MDVSVLVAGIVLIVGGAIVVVFVHRYPQSTRRENKRVRDLTRRARDAGLRGNYTFSQDRSLWETPGEFGSYTPVDDEDRALFDAVGSKIESESAVFARAGLWTDVRLYWVAVPAFLIGGACCVVALFA